MIRVLIVSAFVLAAFIVFIVDLVKIILKVSRKNKVGKSLIISTIISGCLWAILGCVNLFFIITMISNGDPIFDKAINTTADITSKGLVYTFENVEKNWNKDTLEKANQIKFSIISNKQKPADDKESTIYEYKLLLNNTLGKEKLISYWDLESQNLIYALDTNDVFFLAKPSSKNTETIPVGKSYLTVIVKAPTFAKLRDLCIGENKVKLEKD